MRSSTRTDDPGPSPAAVVRLHETVFAGRLMRSPILHCVSLDGPRRMLMEELARLDGTA